jgi:L-alanine-DL-glutamate epimerase-like enolase superfamily enzyme
MKITGISISQHRLHFDPPFHASWDTRPRTFWDATIVRVGTDEGLVGIGSGDLMVGFAGHEHLFVGRDPMDLERHYRVLENIQFHYGRCWPLDLALWDLAGKITGQPVYKLLGGLTDRTRAYASSGTLREPEALADVAERLREKFGFVGSPIVINLRIREKRKR